MTLMASLDTANHKNGTNPNQIHGKKQTSFTLRGTKFDMTLTMLPALGLKKALGNQALGAQGT
jgi:hypothetical protein